MPSYKHTWTRLVIVLAWVFLWTPELLGAVRVGADRLFEEPFITWIRGKKVGLITNASGLNSRQESTRDLLERHPEVDLVALFAPEHGLRAQGQAGEKIASSGKVYSLYGEHLAPTAEMLQEVEILIYDLQDVGVRFYTYISTLFLSMQAAASKSIPFIVLDRPNPINGLRVEGPLLQPGYESFVGVYPLPIRYGMTAGELAQMYNQEANLECELRVIPLSGWRRNQWFEETGLYWTPPSPNMISLSTATVYPGFCLIEGTNLSEGRGTDRPFELIGAPWLESPELIRRLDRLQIPGVRFREQEFVPTSSKYQGRRCRGVRIQVVDRDSFQPLVAALHLLKEIRTLHPRELEFNETFFDRLAGASWIREAIAHGRSVQEIVHQWRSGLENFRRIRKQYILYE